MAYLMTFSVKFLLINRSYLFMVEDLVDLYFLCAISKPRYHILWYYLLVGGEGKFGVNALTGDIYIIGRQMFEDKKVYRLAVSAQAVGAANKSSTPTQVVSVQIGYRAPQLYLDPYNVSIYENDTANDM